MELYREARNGMPLNDEPCMKMPAWPLSRSLAILEVTIFQDLITDEADEEVAKIAQQTVGEMERIEKV